MMKGLISMCAALLAAASFASTASAAVEQAPTANVPAGIEAPAQEDRFRVADAGEFGAGVAVGVIGSLIARGIAEERAREIRDEEWRWEECDREFRSFEWDTGMYTTYGGERRVCPYLLD